MAKKTYLIKARPGTFFMEIEKQKIENDLELKDIIKKYISLDEIEKATYKSLCFFVVEEKIGKKTIATQYHIGEKYNLDRIKEEYGTDCSLYRNVKNNNYKCAIKYIPGNFGGVNKKDICFTQKEIAKIVKDAKKEVSENL